MGMPFLIVAPGYALVPRRGVKREREKRGEKLLQTGSEGASRRADAQNVSALLVIGTERCCTHCDHATQLAFPLFYQIAQDLLDVLVDEAFEQTTLNLAAVLLDEAFEQSTLDSVTVLLDEGLHSERVQRTSV
jgi:hypothetical protein